MTINDAIQSALPRLRAEANARMTSTALIESVTVAADPMTGRDVETPTTVATLPCRVKSSGVQGTRANISSAAILENRQMLHFPWDTTVLRVGMRATITASSTPSLVGMVYRLDSPTQGDQATAQRWEVESWPPTSPS